MSLYVSIRLTITAKCNMELENFPADYQKCPLVVSSCKYYKTKPRKY